jgi:hypothetical protein
MAVYSEGAAEYAEVSSQIRSCQQSPSPYATATLIGNSKIISTDNSNRYNLFYTSEAYPNQNNYNRSIHSESHYNNNNKVNIVENRLANTLLPNMYNKHQHQQQQQYHTSNRLNFVKPQHFRINFGSRGSDSQDEQLYVKVGELSGAAEQQGQMTLPQNASYTWNPQNFNIYENRLHRHQQQHEQPINMNIESSNSMNTTDSTSLSSAQTEGKMLNCDFNVE